MTVGSAARDEVAIFGLVAANMETPLAKKKDEPLPEIARALFPYPWILKRAKNGTDFLPANWEANRER